MAAIEDVPFRGELCVWIGDLQIGLFRVGEKIHAMENACPHRGDPLSDGTLEGPLVTCPSHGWEIDVTTGFRPDDADGWPLPCFSVKLEDGGVWVDPEAPINLGRRRTPPERR